MRVLGRILTYSESYTLKRIIWRRTGKPWHAVQMCLLVVFVNEVLLEHSHATHLRVACGCFHATIAELSCCYRDCMDHKA